MIIKGNDILVYSNGVAIAAAKSCDIEVGSDQLEISSPSTGTWREFIAQRKSWSVSTSYLVTDGNFPSGLSMVGATVTLKMKRRSSATSLGFAGIVSATAASAETENTPTAIYYDEDGCRFIGLDNEEYFLKWPGSEGYTTPGAGYVYRDNSTGTYYLWDDDDLLAYEQLTGSAICTGWKVTATRGNLASGSFEFQGTGELAKSAVTSL